MERERLARQLFFRRITTLVAVDREAKGYIGNVRGWSRRRCHARILRLQIRQNTRQLTESVRCSCPLAKCMSTRWTSTYLSWVGCSPRSFRSEERDHPYRTDSPIRLAKFIRTAVHSSRNWRAHMLNIWSGEAVHAEGVGNLAAVVDIMLDDVPDHPSASVSIYLAFPLILDSRLQI